MHPCVSVLIPLYNAEKYVAESIESALAQTWPNIEIIVVDDGSKDNSLAIAKSFENRGVKVFNQSNNGAAAARNRALQESKGEYIQFLDADDILQPNKIALQMEALSEELPGTIATCAWGKFTNYPIQEVTLFSNPTKTGESPNIYSKPIDWLCCSWGGNGHMLIHAWLVPRKIIHLAGEWNELLSTNDDGEYFCRIVLASKKIKFCDNTCVYYRTHDGDRVSNPNSSVKIASLFQSLVHCKSHLLSKEDSITTRRAVADLFQDFIYSFYPFHSVWLIKAEKIVIDMGGSNLRYKYNKGILKIFEVLLGWKTAVRIKFYLKSLILKI